MFPIFPIVGPTIAGLKLIGEAIAGQLADLITKDVAKSIWNIIKFIFLLAFIIILSFLESVTIDFFNNIVKYWRKDF